MQITLTRFLCHIGCRNPLVVFFDLEGDLAAILTARWKKEEKKKSILI